MQTLSAPDGDINFRTVSGAEAVRQRIGWKVRTRSGEWFLDSRIGTLSSEILGFLAESGNVTQQVLTTTILSIPEVSSVEDVETELDPRTRTLMFRARVILTTGQTVQIERQPF